MFYVAEDPEVCATVSILCLPDWTAIPAECGCGGSRDDMTPTDAFAADPGAATPDIAVAVNLSGADDDDADDDADAYLAPGVIVVDPTCMDLLVRRRSVH